MMFDPGMLGPTLKRLKQHLPLFSWGFAILRPTMGIGIMDWFHVISEGFPLITTVCPNRSVCWVSIFGFGSGGPGVTAFGTDPAVVKNTPKHVKNSEFLGIQQIQLAQNEGSPWKIGV